MTWWKRVFGKTQRLRETDSRSPDPTTNPPQQRPTTVDSARLRTDPHTERPTSTAPVSQVRPYDKCSIPGRMMDTDTYEVYLADTKRDAEEFLRTKTVAAQQYYVIVETPEGIFGRDKMGPYQPSGGWRGTDWPGKPSPRFAQREQPAAQVAPAAEPVQSAEVEVKEGVSLEMVRLAPGDFTMGSPDSEVGREPDEVPHRVKITKSLWVGRYPVTQSQWVAVTGSNPSEHTGPDLPVNSISTADAEVFLAKLNALTKGGRFRLPTEAEWEYACRAGTTTGLNSGKDITRREGACPNTDVVAWYDYNSDQHPHPVGLKPPNRWGLHDMHGNVGELCSDWFQEDYYSGSPQEDPTGPAKGQFRVHRGGYFRNDPWSLRSAARNYIGDHRQENIGLRLVRETD